MSGFLERFKQQGKCSGRRKILDLKSLRSEKHDQETRRSKRGIDEAKFDKAMIKLEKLEGR